MSLLEALSNMARGRLGTAEAAVPKSGSAPPRPTFLPVPEVAVQPSGVSEPVVAGENAEALDIGVPEEMRRPDPEVTDRDLPDLPAQSAPAREQPVPAPEQSAEWQLNVTDPSALDRAPGGVLMPVVMTSRRRVLAANDGDAVLHGRGESADPESPERGLIASRFDAPDPASTSTQASVGARETSTKPAAPMPAHMLSPTPASEPHYREVSSPTPDVTIGALDIIVSPPAEPAAPSPAKPPRPRAVQPSASSQLRRAGVRRF